MAIWFQTTGLENTTASKAAFITALSIVLVPVFKKLIFKTHLKPKFWIAVFLALIGIFLLSFGLEVPEKFNKGDFDIFICSLFYAFYIILLENLVKKHSGPVIMFFSFSFTGDFALLASLIFSSWPGFTILVEMEFLLNLVALVVLGGLIPYLLMAKGQKVVTAQMAALIYIFEPVFAMILAWPLLHEIPTSIELTGSIVIMAALLNGIIIQRS